MHTIKGNASILNLKFFAGKAHEYEEKVGELQNKTDLSGQDFLPLVLKLNEMIETLREVKSLIQRITQFQATFSGEKRMSIFSCGRSSRMFRNLQPKPIKKPICFMTVSMPTSYQRRTARC
jgi:chemotaxis protein histidine kinase CheA